MSPSGAGWPHLVSGHLVCPELHEEVPEEGRVRHHGDALLLPPVEPLEEGDGAGLDVLRRLAVLREEHVLVVLQQARQTPSTRADHRHQPGTWLAHPPTAALYQRQASSATPLYGPTPGPTLPPRMAGCSP